MENHSLKMRAGPDASPEMHPSRFRFRVSERLGWLGRGLGSLMGQARPGRTLELGATQDYCETRR